MVNQGSLTTTCRNLRSIGRRWLLLWLSVALVIVSGIAPALADTDPSDVLLTHMQLNHPSAQDTELELDFNKTPNYQYFTLNNPSRMVMDIHHASLKGPADNIDWSKTSVTHMRVGHQEDDTLRLVLELAAPTKVQVEQMDSGLEHIILIELPNSSSAKEMPAVNTTNTQSYSLTHIALLQQHLATQASQMNTTKPVTIPAPAPTNKTATVSTPKPVLMLTSQSPQHDLVVVIDPGHGGKDPGAKGPNGELEKDVVLSISQQLYQLLSKEPGIHPVMTRHGDYYLPLRERLDVARDDHADVFIAIHADAYDNPYSHGASVYALSLKGASSEAARWLAAKENYSELGGVDLNGKGDMLRSVLIDLSQTATISSSLLLGQAILENLGQLGALHHGDKVEQAPFVVLKSPDIPSVLVETGFISNPQEAQHLENKAYEQAVAVAIAAGLNHYFKEAPPVTG